MLTNRCQHHAQEPTFAARRMGAVEEKVILLALVGTFHATMMVIVELPLSTVSGNGCEEPIVVLGMGVDDASVVRWGTGLDTRTRFLTLRLLATLERTPPLEALAIRAIAPVDHRASVWAEGRACGGQRDGRGVSGMSRIALIEWDDQRSVPQFGAQAIHAEGIAGFVETGDLNGKAQQVAGFVHGEETRYRIMAVVVSHADDQRQLGSVVEGVAREFVVGVPVDPAIVVTVVAPAGGGITVIAFAVTPRVGLFAFVVALAVFASMRVRPGAQFGAVPCDIEVLEVNEPQLDGLGDHAGVEDGFEDAFGASKLRAVEMPRRGGRVWRLGLVEETGGEFGDDVLVLWGILVLVLVGLFVLLGALPLGVGLVEMADALGVETQQAIHEIVEGTDAGDITRVEATNDSVEGTCPHEGDPLIHGCVTTEDHGEERAQQIFGRDGGATIRGVEERQDGNSQSESL